MVKAAPQILARKVTHLSQAATCFRQLITQEPLCHKAEQLECASSTLAHLLSDEALANAEMHSVLLEIKQAFEDLCASYPQSSRQQWRDFIAWNNLRSIYAALEL